MSVHAFVDETRRRHQYVLAVVLVDPGSLAQLRKLMRSLLMPGQRELHFKTESPRRRRLLADRIAATGVQVRIYTADCVTREERARQECLTAVARDLLKLNAHRVVLDTREGRDADDRQTFRRELGDHPRRTQLVYEHVESGLEPLIWIADVVGWCYGAGGPWRQRVNHRIAEVIHLPGPG